MKKMVTVFLALPLCAIPAYSQVITPQSNSSGCALTEATAPGVRGIRLGMTLDQVLALFPGASRRKDLEETLDRAKSSSGEMVYVTFDPATDGGGRSFDGVTSVGAGFYRARIVDFSIIYLGPSWRTVDDWVGKIAESMKLPGTRAWVVGPSETPNKVLRCSGVEIEASIQGGGASIRLRNLSQHAGSEGAASAEAGRRRDFKP